MKDCGGINSLERLKLRCRIDPITDCWLWSMAVYKASNLPIVHARFPWDSNKKKKTTGKRAAMHFKLGHPLKKGWFVWGTCGVSRCCNPDHADYGDAASYGDAMKRFGWHKESPARIAAIRKRMEKYRRLTEDQAKEIMMSELSIEKLSVIYNVGRTTIADIKRGTRYKKTGVANSSVFTWRPEA